jgi:hypothetical protein
MAKKDNIGSCALVEHLPHYTMVKCLSPVNATCTRSKKGKKDHYELKRKDWTRQRMISFIQLIGKMSKTEN